MITIRSNPARPTPNIDPEFEVERKARWWSGWDDHRAGRVRPSDADAAQGWDASNTANSIPTGRIARLETGGSNA